MGKAPRLLLVACLLLIVMSALLRDAKDKPQPEPESALTERIVVIPVCDSPISVTNEPLIYETQL